MSRPVNLVTNLKPYTDPKETEPGFPRYFYAGFWMRSFAFLFDLLCIAAIRTSTLGLVYRVAGLVDTGAYFGLYNLFSVALYLAYFTCLTRFNHGQTLGKMVFGIFKGKRIDLDDDFNERDGLSFYPDGVSLDYRVLAGCI